MQRTPPPVRSVQPSKTYSEEPSPSPQLLQSSFEQNTNTGFDNVTIGRKKIGKEKIPVHEADAPSSSMDSPDLVLQVRNLFAMISDLQQSLQDQREENRQLKAMATMSSATVQPPSEPQVMPAQASRSTAVPGTPLLPR